MVIEGEIKFFEKSWRLTNLMLAMIIRHLNVQIKCLESKFALKDVFIWILNVQNTKLT